MALEARCALCGKKHQVTQEHPSYKKLEKDPGLTFICDMCNNRVRFESEDQQKPKKPM